jgi:hypothetical protein
MPVGNLIPDDRRRLLTAIDALGLNWHGAGSVGGAVLEAIAGLCPPGGFTNTLETGCGRTTLLLSHLSRRHTVFTYTNAEALYKPDDSYDRTRTSELLNARTTRFVLGPTQRTLPDSQFEGPYDFVLLDGPHSYPFVDLEYFYVYPNLPAGGGLAVDDIHIPTVHHLFDFLREDDMFHLTQVVDNTAFFIRTEAPLFNPYGEDWAAQHYNTRRFPVGRKIRFRHAVARMVPRPVKTMIRRSFRRSR